MSIKLDQTQVVKIFCVGAGLFFAMIILFSVCVDEVHGETRTQLIQAVRDRSVALDSDRCPDTLIGRFLNEDQEDIATIGNAIEAETTIVLLIDTLVYALPSDFYLQRSAKINADPELDIGGDNIPEMLKYVPFENYGNSFTWANGRPGQFSIGNDSIHFDRLTENEADTVWLYYWSHAEPMDSGADTMALPKEYKSLLVDKVVLKCMDRLSLGGKPRETIIQEIIYRENKLFGRPVDER